jgi:hypothetical protein
VSGSVASTGSFGSIYTDKNVNASAFVGDGSSLTGIDIPTAAAISGSTHSGVSGSVVSTGSFGLLQVDGANFTSASLARAIPAAGASDIDGLSDCLIEDNSIYIGNDPSGTTSTAQYNVAIGTTALDAVTTGDNNICIGYDAGSAITSGGNNIAIGTGAFDTATTTDACIAIGYNAFASINDTDVLGSIAIGHQAGESVQNGGGNNGEYTFIGYQAGQDANGNGFMCAVGYKAGHNWTDAGGCTAFGQDADINNTSANNTTAIGYGTNTGGQLSNSANTFLGAASGTGANADLGNSMALGYEATITATNEIVLGNANISSLKCEDTSISSVSSDIRIKENVANNDLGLDFINTLRTVTFNKINPYDYPDEIKPWHYQDERDEDDAPTNKAERPATDPNTWQGLIAQEVKQALDDAGIEEERLHNLWRVDPQGKQSVAYGGFITPLLKAIQELSAKVEALENA